MSEVTHPFLFFSKFCTFRLLYYLDGMWATNNILVSLLFLLVSQKTVAHKMSLYKKALIQCLIIKKCQWTALSSYASSIPDFTNMCVTGIAVIIK